MSWLKSALGFAPQTSCPAYDAIARVMVTPYLSPSGERSSASAAQVELDRLASPPSAKGKTIVVLFRRFGCPICQMSAANLLAMAPILKRHDVRIAAVGLDTNSIDDFLATTKWNLGLGIDEKQALYDKLGTINNAGITSIAAWTASLVSIVREGRKASALGFKGNMEGNKARFGGTFVFDSVADGGKCRYAFRHSASSFEPDLHSMLAALDLPKDDMEAAIRAAYPKADKAPSSTDKKSSNL